MSDNDDIRKAQGQRLETVRIAAGFKSARAASLECGWPESTYRAHENGSRTLGLDDAARYIHRFRTLGATDYSDEWVLFGTGQMPTKSAPLLFITEWFKHRGLNDENVGNRLGVGRSTIFRWRMQQHRLDPEKIAVLARELDIQPQDLWNPPPLVRENEQQATRIYLREWRKSLGFNAVEMAECLDIARESYYRIEKYPGRLNVDALGKLANAMSLSPEQFFTPPDQSDPSSVGNHLRSDLQSMDAPVPGRQPRRPHYIAEWTKKRGLRQVDLASELAADKGLVSKWFSGTSPSAMWQKKLAEFFDCEPDGIFRHPDEDWVVKFFHNRPLDEVDRIKRVLELAFPRG